MNLTEIIILLAGLVVSAAICVALNDLLKMAIALAATSGLLAIIMFVLGAPLAAVFELSVCAGLITVVFISAINMTRVSSKEELEEKQKARNKRFLLLPVLIIVLIAGMLVFLWPQIDSLLPTIAAGSGESVKDILWNKRQVDLLGQIAIILAGVYGVIIFFKESDAK